MVTSRIATDSDQTYLTKIRRLNVAGDKSADAFLMLSDKHGVRMAAAAFSNPLAIQS